MKKVILLRGVTPTGQNRIPKMSYLAEILTEVGFSNVQTYIQSGNVILETDMPDQASRKLIHDTILEKIGADLSIIIKEQEQLAKAVQENPFNENYDLTRVHLVFTNNNLNQTILDKLEKNDFGAEILKVGSQCLYLYLPRDAKKKKLNTNFLEKQLSIIATMRKLSVTSRLSNM